MRNSKDEQILKLLIRAYGNKAWQPEDPMIVLVRTILSQNTSDRNSHRAFASLLATFGSWQNITAASTSAIANSIRIGGLSEVKAKYIKNVLNEIERQRGDFNLAFLKQLPLEKARDWLLRLPGVGMKTASCVLLFSFGIPAMPVDTHIFRVSRRLGLISPSVSIDQAHDLLGNLVQDNQVYAFHVLLIEHGRKTCKAQRPHCRECVLQKICPSFRKLAYLDPHSSVKE